MSPKQFRKLLAGAPREHLSDMFALLIWTAAVGTHYVETMGDGTHYAETMGHDLPVAGRFLSNALYNAVMHELPIPTADVLVLSHDLERTLLFNRTNKPVQSVFYSIGGRIFKNERLSATALRKLHKELPKLGGMVSESDLVLGGVMQEVFSDSAFADTNSHCVNSVFGLVLAGGRALEADLAAAEHDSQSTRARWFSVDDARLHPYMKQKLSLLLPLPALAEKACRIGGAASEGACTAHLYRSGAHEQRRCVWQPERGVCSADSTPRGELCERVADGESTRLDRIFVDPQEIGLLRSDRRVVMADGEALLMTLFLIAGVVLAVAAMAIRRSRRHSACDAVQAERL